jgi:ATP-dependent DNA ligase
MILRTMPKKNQPPAAKATFIETMECLPVNEIPQGREWSYELKLDGYRLEAVKNAGEVTLYSRRRTVLNHKFGYIAVALKKLPDSTVLDGELVAMDPEGRADFQLLQNFRSAELRRRQERFAEGHVVLSGASRVLDCDRDVATDGVREASRSHASDSP